VVRSDWVNGESVWSFGVRRSASSVAATVQSEAKTRAEAKALNERNQAGQTIACSRHGTVRKRRLHGNARERRPLNVNRCGTMATALNGRVRLIPLV
jgi:hypothetical protein